MSLEVQSSSTPAFETLEQVVQETPEEKIRVLGYAKNGNDLVMHRKAAHRIGENAYIFKTTDKNQQTYGTLCAMLPCGYAVEISKGITSSMFGYSVFRGTSGEKPAIEMCVESASHCKTVESFLAYLNGIVKKNAYLNSLDLRVASDLLPEASPQLAIYKAYRQEIIAIREARALERERIEQEEEERKKKEEEERQSAKRMELCSRLAFANGEVDIDPRVLLDLSDRLGIPCPLRLRGWIIQRLSALVFQNGSIVSYRYHRTSKRQNGSNSFWAYIESLLSAIQREKRSKEDD